MMKKMTNDEIQAFYNELESKRLEIKQDLEVHPSKYEGMTSDEKKWIKGDIALKDTKEPFSAVHWLFRDKEEERKTEVVLDALEATQHPKFVEIARKYAIVKPAIPSETKEKMQMAKVILSNTGLGADYALSSYSMRPDKAKVTTVGKELEQIKKRHKKLSAHEVKAMRKYTHISEISMTSLYYSFSGLCRRLSPSDADSILGSDHFAADRRHKFVLEHQDEVISLFIDSPELKFAHSQKAGKLK